MIEKELGEQNQLKQELEAHFLQAASAHHQAFLATDGEDPEWAVWYAGYLQDELAKRLNTTFTQSLLSDLLIEVDQKYRDDRPGIGWAEYYAGFFLTRFS